jgi:hypothetical protein
MKRNKLFADACKRAGIDLNKDFFELRNDEITTVDEIRRAFRYSGKNAAGRSRVRQFYYAAQNGNK